MTRFAIAAIIGLSTLGLVPIHAVSQTPDQATLPGTLDVLSWLQGSWVRQSSRGKVTERWTRVSENTMEGIAISMSGETIRVTEHLRIEQLGSEIFYTAKPAENRMPTPFKLIEVDENRFVFHNEAHDFPQTIAYHRVDEDGLLVRIEGPVEGKIRKVDFRFTRSTATPPSSRP